MANDLNQWQGIGRLGKDPEVRALSNGTTVANFSMACGWKSGDKEGTEWVNVSSFGKLAEIIGQYLTKGSQVFIQGRLNTRTWDKDGETRYSTEIVADRMQMLGGRTGQQNHPQQSAPKKQDFDEDVPF